MSTFKNWTQADVDRHNSKGREIYTESEHAVDRESDIHDQIAAFCRERGFFFIHSRMDRRTTITVGAPDFTIALPGGLTLWLECKRKGGKPTVEQQGAILHLRRDGHIAYIVDNFLDAQRLIMGAMPSTVPPVP